MLNLSLVGIAGATPYCDIFKNAVYVPKSMAYYSLIPSSMPTANPAVNESPAPQVSTSSNPSKSSWSIIGYYMDIRLSLSLSIYNNSEPF